MGPKIIHISFSTEIKDKGHKNEWFEEFRKFNIALTDDFDLSNVVIFVGDWVSQHRWDEAQKQNKLIYNLTGLSVEKGIEMLKILIEYT